MLLEAYIDVLKRLAKEFNLELIDIYSPMLRMANKNKLFRRGDGVHVNNDGSRYIAKQILLYLGKDDINK